MKLFIVGILFITSWTGFSQKNLTILFGNGFDSVKCTLILSYWQNESYKVDTLMLDELLIDDNITGLTYSISAKIPKKTMKEMKLLVDGKKYNFRFDQLKNNAQLKIEFLDGIDFCLLQKRKFEFH